MFSICSQPELAMSLADIVKALGGDHCGPGRAVIPGPGHSPGDRSVSLLVARDGRLVVASFGRSDWREVLDDLRARRFIDRQNRLMRGGSGEGYVTSVRTQAEKLAAAERLWARGAPIGGTLSEGHLRTRAVRRPLPGDSALRHLAAAPLRAYADAGPWYPAMLAGIRTQEGRLTAVEITYLDGRGRRRQGLKLSRKIIGIWAAGSAVRLDPADERLLVGEGVLTTLSASERFDLPGWALLSTSRFEVWRPPPEVGSLLIAGDNGTAGRRAAQRLRHAIEAEGVAARMVYPPGRFDDFNSEAQALAAAPRPSRRHRA
jgi:hypothetical protein